jgi:hypothetical protein
LVGHSGGGKSETARYLAEHYKQSTATRRPTETQPQRIDDPPLLSGRQGPALYIDLEGPAEFARKSTARGHPEIGEIETQFLIDLASQIGVAFLKFVDENRQDLSKTAHDIMFSLFATAVAIATSNRSLVRLKLANAYLFSQLEKKCSHLLSSRDTSKHAWANFCAAIENCGSTDSYTNAERSVMLWISVLDMVAKMKFGGYPVFILVLDNIDTAPLHIQSLVSDLLTTTLKECELKVLLPVRIPTAISFFRGVFKCSPHCGPIPRDIAIARLLEFLRKPNSFSAYRSLGEHEKNFARSLVMELAARLTDTNEHCDSLPNVMGLASGLSTRRAFSFLSNVLVKASNDPSACRTIEANPNNLNILATYSFYDRLARTIGADIISIARKNELQRKSTNSIRRFGSECAKKIINTITIYAQTKTQDHATLMESAVSGDSSAFPEFAMFLLQWHLDRSIQNAREMANRRGLQPQTLNAILQAVKDRLVVPKKCASGVRGRIITETTAVLRGVIDASLDPDHNNDFECPSLMQLLSAPAKPTHEARPGRRLYFVNQVIEQGDRCLDIFHLPLSRRPTWVILRLLFRLRRREERNIQQLSVVIDDLRAQGVSNDEIPRILEALTEYECRLLSLDERPKRKADLDVWRGFSSQTIHLTLIGWNYISQLAAQLVYQDQMFWFRQNCGLVKPALEQRIKYCLDKLTEIHDNEIAWLEKVKENAIRPGAPRGHQHGTPCITYSRFLADMNENGAVALDLAARTTPSVIHACTKHFDNLRQDQDSVEQLLGTRAAALLWHNFLQSGLSEALDLLSFKKNRTIRDGANPLLDARVSAIEERDVSMAGRRWGLIQAYILSLRAVLENENDLWDCRFESSAYRKQIDEYAPNQAERDSVA